MHAGSRSEAEHTETLWLKRLRERLKPLVLTEAETHCSDSLEQEQDPEDYRKRKSDPNVFARQFPEWDHPTSAHSGGKRSIGRNRHLGFLCVLSESAPVGEPGYGDDGHWHSVIGTDSAQVLVHKGRVEEKVEEVGNNAGEDREAEVPRRDLSSQPDDEMRGPLSSDSQNAEERSSIIRLMKLTGNDLNPVLKTRES